MVADYRSTLNKAEGYHSSKIYGCFAVRDPKELGEGKDEYTILDVREADDL
jgi:hypothetical protein